jgi:hypothetical protein
MLRSAHFRQQRWPAERWPLKLTYQGLEGSTCLARGFGKVTGLDNGADHDCPQHV